MATFASRNASSTFKRPARSNAVGGHVIAGVTAENPDGGPDRQGGEFAEPLHYGAAFLAMTKDIVLLRRLRRNVRVIRRHDGSPQDYESLAMKLAPEAFEIVACVFQPMSTKGPQRRKRRASLPAGRAGGRSSD